MKVPIRVAYPDKVPVRVQVWLPDGIRLDLRAWIDDLTLTNDLPPLDEAWKYPTPFRPLKQDVLLRAHTDIGWKFDRGKPKV